jgi:nitrite reductase/ring-hydroxylating ferredoxin subunit
MAEFHRVAAVTDFQEGLVRAFPVAGIEIGVVHHQGVWHAFTARCPHANYLMNYTRIKDGDRILCSSHMAWFDLHTGCVLAGPTDQNLRKYPIRIEDNDVLVSPEPL